MYSSPSHLPETARVEIANALNARRADGLDLHSQTKVALGSYAPLWRVKLA